MNDLEKYFYTNKKRSMDKWVHYFKIYDELFKNYRGLEIKILEIGVQRGGSLQMWKSYFGNKSQIYGIDVDPKSFYAEENITIEIGSQEDRSFLNEFAKKHGFFDIIIDDGGHTMNQQIVSLEELYPFLKNNGIYLCEDTHTSYMASHGGGFKNPNSFLEYSKNLVDIVNNRSNKTKNEIFGNNLASIHFYEDIVVLRKTTKPPRYRKKIP